MSLILNRSRAKNEWKLSDLLKNLLCSFFLSFGNVAGTSTGGGGGTSPPSPLTSSFVLVSFMLCLIDLPGAGAVISSLFFSCDRRHLDVTAFFGANKSECEPLSALPKVRLSVSSSQAQPARAGSTALRTSNASLNPLVNQLRVLLP